MALANLGDACLQLGQFEEARDALVRAGQINSNDAKLHLLLGEAYLSLGRRDEAFREVEALRQLDGSLADTLARLLNAPS